MQIKVFDGPIMVTQSKFDLCEKKVKPDLIRCNMAGWGIPPRCAFEQNSTFCYKGNKILTLSVTTQKMLPLFSVARAVAVRIEIKHDTGISCFEADTKVSKKAWCKDATPRAIVNLFFNKIWKIARMQMIEFVLFRWSIRITWNFLF